MKSFLLSAVLLFTGYSAFSQVGIGTPSPQASLDIIASDVSAPANNDGLLIPRIDEFPLTPPTLSQNGMLVFITGDGAPIKGFYYWDEGSTSWISIAGIAASIGIDDLIDGKSDSDGTQDGSSVFLGIDAGAADDSSNNRNVGVGYQSLQDNTVGSQNTALGYNSLRNNTDGESNTAVGSSSLDANTTGIWNTAIGQAALNANVDGSYNTAVGRGSLMVNSSGNSNVTLGVWALSTNATGSFNTVIGTEAATSMTANNSNTIIGRRAMNSFSSGDNNVALGASAGYYGSGSENTYIGTTAGFSPGAPARSGSVFIGYGAGSAETTDNKLYIENSVADADNALIYGEFDTNILRTNGEIQIGNPTGTGYALPVADGTANQVLATDGSGQISFVNAGGGGSADADWFAEGTTAAPGAITDDIFTEGNVAIGKNTADTPLDIELSDATANPIVTRIVDNGTGTGDHVGLQQTMGGTHSEGIKGTELYVTNTGTGLHTGMLTSVQNGGGNQIGHRTIVNGTNGINTLYSGAIFNSGSASTQTQTAVDISVQQPSSQISYGIFSSLTASGASATGVKYGLYNLITAGTGEHFGVYNDVRGAESNTKYGVYNNFGIGSTDTGGVLYGTYNRFGGSITSTTNKYGTFTEIPSSLAGTHYGIYSDAQNASGYSGYFIGRMSLGASASNRYIMPAADGNAGEVLTTDGAGNTSWSPASGTAPYVARINLSTSQTIPANSTEKILFNNVNFESSPLFDTANSRFVAPNTGYYQINSSFYAFSNSGSGAIYISVYVNGVAYQRPNINTSANAHTKLTSCIVSLAANDTVEIYALTGSIPFDIGSPNLYSYFEIQEIK